MYHTIDIVMELIDAHGCSTTAALEAMEVFKAESDMYPGHVRRSYYVVMTLGSIVRRCWITPSFNHYEALDLAAETTALTQNATGECIIVGQCGIDQCACDGEIHAMRWAVSIYVDLPAIAET